MYPHQKAYLLVVWHTVLAAYAGLAAFNAAQGATGWLVYTHAVVAVCALATAIVWITFGQATRQEARVGR